MSKIKIIKASVMGCCVGVSRALEVLNRSLAEAEGRAVYTIGPLIHNQRVLDEYADKGAKIVNSPDDEIVGNSIAVIRAHGLAPRLKNKYLTKRLDLRDATCYRLLKSQQLMVEHNRRGRQLVVVGNPDHGEVEALVGYAPGAVVIENPEQARDFKSRKEIAVIAQTTVQSEVFEQTCKIIKNKHPNTFIENTLCPAVKKRQAALAAILPLVEAVLVIGGKNSANTIGLYRTAFASGKPVWHIEGASEIPAQIFDLKTIGLTAGASTVDWLIKEVEEALLANSPG